MVFDVDSTLTSGNYIDNAIGIKLDSPLHTMSSMVEFDVLNAIPSDGQTIYRVGYVSPIVAGRVYGNNRNETWLDSASTTAGRLQDTFYLVNGQGIPKGGFMHLLDNKLLQGSESSSAGHGPQTFNHIYEDDWANGSTTKGQYMSRYGPAIWRYTNKHQGDFIQALAVKGVLNAESNDVYNDYYENGGLFNFSLSSYRATGGTRYEMI